ncbi:MAG: lysozyme inhibitor LprI family protein [Pseudomonadota bacterium]
MIRRFVLALTLVSAPAYALDCREPVTQLAMNQCAQREFQGADEDLNLAYKLARAYAKTLGPDAADKLRDAQRAWIPFRDLACEVEGLAYEGGSMQPLVVNSCLAQLTRQRTEQLRAFGEVN